MRHEVLIIFPRPMQGLRHPELPNSPGGLGRVPEVVLCDPAGAVRRLYRDPVKSGGTGRSGGDGDVGAAGKREQVRVTGAGASADLEARCGDHRFAQRASGRRPLDAAGDAEPVLGEHLAVQRNDDAIIAGQERNRRRRIARAAAGLDGQHGAVEWRSIAVPVDVQALIRSAMAVVRVVEDWCIRRLESVLEWQGPITAGQPRRDAIPDDGEVSGVRRGRYGRRHDG